ncbi:mariner transposase [Trichonephila clavipes]|nr:mariner transposase [Trichonephila clavipes]
MMDRIFICEAFAKRNKISIPKWMVTGDEKWITYDNNVRKRSWSKRGEADQTVAKPGLTARKAREHREWRVDDWKPVAQGDESRFQLLNADLRLRIRCQAHAMDHAGEGTKEW